MNKYQICWQSYINTIYYLTYLTDKTLPASVKQYAWSIEEAFLQDLLETIKGSLQRISKKRLLSIWSGLRFMNEWQLIDIMKKYWKQQTTGKE